MSLLRHEPGDPPVKRKRGRPAKLKKDEGNYPSFTMQFRAFPESISPSAELDSNMIMQMGEPDAFTPLMKVSPTLSRKKARKATGVATPVSDSPFWDDLANPQKLKPCMGITPGTMNKLSLITSSDIPPPPYLTSPPNSALKPSLSMSPDLKELRYSERNKSRAPKSLPLKNEPAFFPKGEQNVMKPNCPRNVSFVEDNFFSFKLTVDDGGRAALAARHDDDEQVSANTGSDNACERSSIVSSGAGSSLSIESCSVFGTLVSSDTDEGVEQASGNKFIVPQTPIQKEHETPRMDSAVETYNTAFNLTPQFNTMMYSMMSINSPQMKQSSSLQVSYGHSPLHVIDCNEDQRSRKPDALETAMNTAHLMEGELSGMAGFCMDEGDARSALKKAFRKY